MSDREFRLYCVKHKEFIGKDLPDTIHYDGKSEPSDEDDTDCLFRYKEIVVV